jgi:hypothetical protein
MSEHTIVIGKLSVAGAAGRKDEFQSYAGMLAANGADLTALMRSALGETAGAQFGDAWTAGNNSYVDYLVAAVTVDQAKAAAATSSLTSSYVPQLAQLLTSSLSLPPDKAKSIVTGEVSAIKLVIDDAVAAKPAALYSDLDTAYRGAVASADALAAAVAAKFPDRFPGDPSAAPVTARALLDMLLQEHAYLTTMASDAFYAGAAADQDAATSALATSTDALSRQLGMMFGGTARDRAGRLWEAEDGSLVAYAKARDQTAQFLAEDSLHNESAPQLANFLHSLSGATVDVNGQILATIQVLSDQNAKGYPQVAGDDRTAAALLIAIGDAVGGGGR